ncbi:uncharacterized protein Tco025E_03094 [Trypanosoma conorhini]|uniref:Uncharacterized protein n=1 Tax=Trypanosoma conorhini TaxID=83891 RepID=A0A422PY60_9TRYP|nr:uncharacterized protein Tco025E_03094 [Trypanosoma conorhini]RNF22701.1 hypothetical protein Tco025E_03094 [Trypanosoma conorhini]
MEGSTVARMSASFCPSLGISIISVSFLLFLEFLFSPLLSAPLSLSLLVLPPALNPLLRACVHNRQDSRLPKAALLPPEWVEMATTCPQDKSDGHEHPGGSAEGTLEQAPEQPHATVSSEGGLALILTSSVPRSDGSTDHEFCLAAGSPSPLPVAAASTVSRGESSPESSPRLMVQELAGSTANRANDSNDHEELYSPLSAAGLQSPMADLPRRERAALMPPPPSPGEADTSGAVRAHLHATVITETHLRELQLTMQENRELRRELATARASLREAQQTAESRELECVELHRLVDKLQAQMSCLQLVSRRKLSLSSTQEPRKGNLHTASSTSSMRRANGASGSQLLGDNEDRAGRGIPPSREIPATEPRQDTQLELSTTSDLAAANVRSTSNSAAVGEQASLQKLCEERDMLAKELARAKVVVAEQETILDRLGLHFPYPGGAVGAARRIIPVLEPLQKKHTRKRRPLVQDCATHLGGGPERKQDSAEK